MSDTPATPVAISQLWFLEDAGGEIAIFNKHDGTVRMSAIDDEPEGVIESCPEGWSVWNGTIRTITAEMIAEQEPD